MSDISTHDVGDRWVIADGSGWRAGIYDSDATARHAHRVVGDRMEAMWDDWVDRAGSHPTPMTRADIRAWCEVNL